MTGKEIKEKIDLNNKAIEQFFGAETFVLDCSIAELLKENDVLSAKCPHEFKNGHCIYCYKEEK